MFPIVVWLSLVKFSGSTSLLFETFLPVEI